MFPAFRFIMVPFCLTAAKAKYTFDFSEEEEGADDADEDQDNEPPASPVRSYKESFSTAQSNNNEDEDDDDDIFSPKPAITSYVHFPLIFCSSIVL